MEMSQQLKQGSVCLARRWFRHPAPLIMFQLRTPHPARELRIVNVHESDMPLWSRTAN
jgi:hypothetical protein